MNYETTAFSYTATDMTLSTTITSDTAHTTEAMTLFTQVDGKLSVTILDNDELLVSDITLISVLIKLVASMFDKDKMAFLHEVFLDDEGECPVTFHH